MRDSEIKKDRTRKGGRGDIPPWKSGAAGTPSEIALTNV